MTTIAVRKGVMACDSRLVTGDRYYVCGDKIKIIGNAIVGAAGSANDIAKFMEWFEAQEKEKPELEDVDALVLDSRGLWHYTNGCYPDRIRDGMWSCGSGGDAAYAAMLCGKTAAEAVSIAIKCDTNSGGPVRVAHLNNGHPAFTKRK